VTDASPTGSAHRLTEATARERFSANDLLIRSFDIAKVDRAVNEDDRHGLIKIITRRNSVILGVSMMGERAGEAITEIGVAMHNRLKLSELSATIHPYPTYSTGIQLLATKMAVELAFSGASGKFIRYLSSVWR
jgi:pyruvate/2-oxoglutarate dehydrogenase complex dihydrolipoamide dehydrogenase (E3) component